MDQVSGGCLCGEVRLNATGRPNRVGICHCLDCRKHHGALFFAAAIFPLDAVQVEGETRTYLGRHFCPCCGSSVFAHFEDEIEVHLGSLASPDQFVPDYELLMFPRFRGHGFRPFVVRPVPGSCIRGRSGSAADYSSPRYTRTDRVWHHRGLPIAAGGRVRP